MTMTSTTNADHYPVKIDEVVALGLAPTPAGEIDCHVGLVIGVDRFGVRLALLHWLIGEFDREVFAPWRRIEEIHWAQPDGPGSFACDPLGVWQAEWTGGAEGRERYQRVARENARDAAAAGRWQRAADTAAGATGPDTPSPRPHPADDQP
jgi:hypothetical protein